MISASATKINASIRERRALDAAAIEAAANASQIVAQLRKQLAAKDEKIAELKETLKDMETGARVSARGTMAEVSKRRDMPMQALLGPSRAQSVVIARYEAIYEVARRCSWMSLSEIGRLFDRDHTTIIHALRVWPEKAQKYSIPVLPLGREEVD
ncbi:helix-turn-helix domain-containing protein [Aureimonas sp. AU20]|uniref:helix-turn-helix domain-containing protein n=1 Tax=Aureimonas sp. AU20 TaxID=1349819 RepID=UPI00071F4313|nr:helix-turn-helix domain-containing protein [Aureimonas sp. AU20]ALN73546.1 hypothetical protein M673_12540 [Aureimonas sp. AU20]